ncbi:MAG TPA: hypothetical protein PLC61_09095, partial [Chitinophagales bacterium]|nr:hypothetical protein [Chitinophagales bacterium]
MIKQRKKILFLTPQLPYPVHSGGFIKSYRMLVHLAAQHDVDFASLLKGEDVQLLEEFKASIPNIMQFFTVPSNIERNAINILKANLQFKPIS